MRWRRGRSLVIGLLLGSAPGMTQAGAEGVSLVQVIAQPERYDGLRIRMTGAFQFQFEEQALYLHTEDRTLLNSRNAVWIEVPPELASKAKELSGTFVLLEGRLVARQKGHLGAYAASIDGVSRLERAPTREEFGRGSRH